MQWPDTIGMAIEVIDSVKFLTEEQRRDVFYNNAARFLRLSASDGRVGPRLPGPPFQPERRGTDSRRCVQLRLEFAFVLLLLSGVRDDSTVVVNDPIPLVSTTRPVNVAMPHRGRFAGGGHDRAVHTRSVDLVRPWGQGRVRTP